MGRTVVLVVEDESMLRLDAVQMVQVAGYSVLAAQNADDAIKLLEERSDISVVFTDINMPGSMDGLKLARAVRDRWPPVRLIVTSGKIRPTPSDIPEGGHFLPKPYTSHQVASLLHQLAA